MYADLGHGQSPRALDVAVHVEEQADEVVEPSRSRWETCHQLRCLDVCRLRALTWTRPCSGLRTSQPGCCVKRAFRRTMRRRAARRDRRARDGQGGSHDMDIGRRTTRLDRDGRLRTAPGIDRFPRLAVRMARVWVGGESHGQISASAGEPARRDVQSRRGRTCGEREGPGSTVHPKRRGPNHSGLMAGRGSDRGPLAERERALTLLGCRVWLRPWCRLLGSSSGPSRAGCALRRRRSRPRCPAPSTRRTGATSPQGGSA